MSGQEPNFQPGQSFWNLDAGFDLSEKPWEKRMACFNRVRSNHKYARCTMQLSVGEAKNQAESLNGKIDYGRCFQGFGEAAP
jgi:hypothetical protein